MPITIINEGNNNVVNIEGNVIESQNGFISLSGDNNTVTIKDGCILNGAQIKLLGNSSFYCGEKCILNSIEAFAVDGSIYIADYVAFTCSARLFLHEKGSISIGESSLIASDVLLTASDMHSIFDLESGKRLNFARNILIGEKVLLAEGCRILKGAIVSNNSVVGMNSIVTGYLPPNTVSVGAPARVVRENITWSQELARE